MKKVILTIIFVIATLTLAHAQADWINYKIDDKLSIKLPSEPTTIEKGVTANSKDSLFCFVSIIGETDSASLAKLILAPNFASGLKTALIENQTDLILGDLETGKWHNYNCYNIDGIRTSKKQKVSFRFLIIGGRIYSLGAIMPDNHDINEKHLFFDSLRLN